LLNERAGEAFRNVKARFPNDEHEVLAIIFGAMQQAVEEQRAVKKPFIEEHEKARDNQKGKTRSAKDLFR
jgi:hypothetical protein